jgi:rubrerythrin
MVERLIEHLEFADLEARSSQSKNDGKLTFVIVVPTCESKKKRDNFDNLIQNFANESFRRMTKCPFFVKHIVLKAREHGYVEGSQHLRQTRYKESQYDTSVVILQSQSSRDSEAEKPMFTSDEFNVDLRESFTSRHQLELDERRLKMGGEDENDDSESSEPKQRKRKKKTKGKKSLK